MSYCRFSKADVYVYPSKLGLECCGCWLPPVEGRFRTRSIEAMADHLAEHRAANHYVPDDVMPAIRADEKWLIAENVIDNPEENP